MKTCIAGHAAYLMKNKLHSVLRIQLVENGIAVIEREHAERKPCGCNIGADHLEDFEAYTKRARKEGYA